MILNPAVEIATELAERRAAFQVFILPLRVIFSQGLAEM